MVRIRSAVEVRHVARIAIRGCSCITSRMALVTTGACVLTSEREARVVMVECCRGPTVGAVALPTINWESGLGVVRRCGGRIVRHVARVAVGRGAGEAVGMALHAVHRGMLARQRERRGVVVEGGRVPVPLIVAQRTVRGKARRHVVRIGGGRVLR